MEKEFAALSLWMELYITWWPHIDQIKHLPIDTPVGRFVGIASFSQLLFAMEIREKWPAVSTVDFDKHKNSR